MTHATSARTTDRDRLRSRSAGTARGVVPENAPVLFRLPVIAAAEPVPPPVVERTAMASGHRVGESTPVSMPAVSAVSESAAASLASPTVQAKIEHPATTSVLGAQRSWWEHWSSGVVLILLIIALVTASILALNDGGKGRVAQLAGEPLTDGLDEFDLSNVTIPDMVTPALPVAAAGNQSGSTPVASTGVGKEVAEPTSDIAVQAAAIAQSKTASQSQTEVSGSEITSKPEEMPSRGLALDRSLELTSKPLASELNSSALVAAPTNAVPVASTVATSTTLDVKTPSGESSQPPQATLTLPTAANLAGGMTTAMKKVPTDNHSELQTNASSPLASLDLPVGIAPLPLFDPNDIGPRAGLPAVGSAGVSVPSLTASGPTATPYNAASNSAPTAPSTQSLPGSSPTFYDGAAIGSELHAGAVSGGGPVDTNLPSYATILASATRSVTNSAANQPPAANQPIGGSTLGAATPSTGTQPATAAMQSTAVPSATPELDIAAIVNAYRHFSEINQGSSGTASNRYPTATSPASGAGFTLGTPSSR